LSMMIFAHRSSSLMFFPWFLYATDITLATVDLDTSNNVGCRLDDNIRKNAG
jgi:hypothetical protein